MPPCFSYRSRVGIIEVPHTGVATDQNELAKVWALTAGLEQPKHSLDRHVHDRFRTLLRGCQVQYVGDTVHGARHAALLLDGSPQHLYPIVRGQHAIVTQRSNAKASITGVIDQATNERLPDFAGGTGDQDAALLGFGAGAPRCFFSKMSVHGSAR